MTIPCRVCIAFTFCHCNGNHNLSHSIMFSLFSPAGTIVDACGHFAHRSYHSMCFVSLLAKYFVCPVCVLLAMGDIYWEGIFLCVCFDIFLVLPASVILVVVFNYSHR